MAIAVPLYVENRYFNILQAKGHAFAAGCIAGALLVAFSVFGNKYASKLRPKQDLTDWGLVILACSAIISCLLCGNFKAAFWGERGWCVGGFAFLMAAFLYMYLSKSFYMNQNFWLPVMAANGFIFVLGILHSAGIDALGIHTNIDPSQFYQYISTIGNVNMYVGYLCLILPALACFFIGSEGRASQLIYLIVIALCELNMILAGSDGLYLGIGVCAFFAFPYVFGSKRSAFRLSLLILIYGLGLVLVSMSPAFAEKREMIGGVSAIFLRPEVFTAVITLGVIGIAVFSLTNEGSSKKLLRILIIVSEAALGATAMYFVIKTVASFEPGWGSGRGAIWMAGLDIFKGFGPVQKIFGAGPEMLGQYFVEQPTGISRKVLAAHSEPLQILLSTGIVGFVGWILIWAGVLRRFFVNKLWRSPAIAYLLPLMAYLGQSMVNTPMATNWGILIMMLSLFVYNQRFIH